MQETKSLFIPMRTSKVSTVFAKLLVFFLFSFLSAVHYDGSLLQPIFTFLASQQPLAASVPIERKINLN